MSGHTYFKVTTTDGHIIIEARHDDGELCSAMIPLEYDDAPYDVYDELERALPSNLHPVAHRDHDGGVIENLN